MDEDPEPYRPPFAELGAAEAPARPAPLELAIGWAISVLLLLLVLVGAPIWLGNLDQPDPDFYREHWRLSAPVLVGVLLLSFRRGYGWLRVPLALWLWASLRATFA